MATQLKQPEQKEQPNEQSKPSETTSQPLSESEQRLLEQLSSQGGTDTIPPDHAQAPGADKSFEPTDTSGNPIVQPVNDEEIDPENPDFDGDEFCSSLAVTAVGVLDLIHTVVLPPYYESLVLGNVDKVKLYSVLNKMKDIRFDDKGKIVSYPEYDGEEQFIVTKIGDVKKFEEKAKFKEAEAKKLEQHFDRFFRSMGWDMKVPAWVELTMALAAVEQRILGPLWKAKLNSKKETAQNAQKAKQAQKEAA